MSNLQAHFLEADAIRKAVFDGLERDQWKGWDPFDGLASPFFRPLLARQNNTVMRWLGILLLQAVKRSPVNLRPMLKIPRQENPMTWAAGLLGFLEGAQRNRTASPDFVEKACGRLLALADAETALWGYPFPWGAKAFYLNPGDPNLVISSLCLRALAKAAIFADGKTTQTAVWKEHYRKALPHLFRLFYKPEAGYFSYVTHAPVLVHNANLFGVEAALHAEAIGIALPAPQAEQVQQALQKTLSQQAASGRWAYGAQPHHQWCDNFHTAYNLVALDHIHRLSPHKTIPPAVERGLAFYRAHAFTAAGEARYYDNRTWPLETHSAAVALICLKTMAEGNWMEKEEAQRQALAVWTALKKGAYLGNGNFAYRRGRWIKTGTVFNRWTQSWVYYALESLLSLCS